ncbi:AAA family ATPase [Oceanobacillus sp. J11TS1]|uniref:AAA family ATPase n=1 Tax=Oceanobacillus sp. J11TS1 TaxID=2807191 RepID=UPI001B18E719|nr:AAA family ATPase [Oceanobacillus sp. J11TS1]GIO23475.1 hypothetical protein J11TS1_20560 [Oceanobacillus sp. J11TS1]
MSLFSLAVQKFGSVENAKIDVSKFMIFVGENNTGKSYVLQLIWGIIDNKKYVINHSEIDGLKNEFKTLLDEQKGKLKETDAEKVYFTLPPEFFEKALEYFNESLNTNKSVILNNVFNSRDISVGHLQLIKDNFPHIKISYSNMDALIEQFQEDKTESEAEKNKEKRVRIELFVDENRIITWNYPLKAEKYAVSNIVENVILFAIFEEFDGFYENASPVYFPASRAAFMQVYRSLLSSNIREKITMDHQLSFDFSEDMIDKNTIPGLTITKAVTDFMLSLLNYEEMPEEKNRYKNELSYISRSLTEGKIIKNNDNRMMYVPSSDKQTQLPMHLTSSLIAETAPFYLFLSDKNDRPGWIVEEVETHLHPTKQLKLVKLFFKLINKGKYIWITTHSDSVAQQINNLLLLSQKYTQENFNQLNSEQKDIIKEDEIIDMKDVSLYQFVRQNDKTSISHLEFGEYGYDIKTFNDLLDSLYDETEIIQEIVDSWRDK